MALATALGIGQAVFSAVGMISDFLGSRSAEKAAKRQARLEAEAEEVVTAEKMRQLRKEERTLRGDTRAFYAGPGGVKVTQGTGTDRQAASGSVAAVLAEQAQEYATQRAITEKVGASKVASALQRGQNVASQARYSGYGALGQGASNLFSILRDI